ncbi:MAG: glycoside hydrolase family 3 N-terminal domain-containing protein, partial [bacterium]
MNDARTTQPLGALMVDVVGESLRGDECDFLRHPAVGAVILFARNYRSRAQVAALVAEIKAVRAPALLVAVDQEGGRVQRFAAGFHPLPALARIGALHRRDRARAREAKNTASLIGGTKVMLVGVD